MSHERPYASQEAFLSQQPPRLCRLALGAAKAVLAVGAGISAASAVTTVAPTEISIGPTNVDLTMPGGFSGNVDLFSMVGDVDFPHSYVGSDIKATVQFNDGILNTISHPDGFNQTKDESLDQLESADTGLKLAEFEGKAVLGFIVGSGFGLFIGDAAEQSSTTLSKKMRPSWLKKLVYGRNPEPDDDDAFREPINPFTYTKKKAIASLAFTAVAVEGILPVATFNRNFTENMQSTSLIAKALESYDSWKKLDQLNEDTAAPIARFLHLVDVLKVAGDTPVNPTLCMLVGSDAHGGPYGLIDQMFAQNKANHRCEQITVLDGDTDDTGTVADLNRPSHTGVSTLVSENPTFETQGNHDSKLTMDDLKQRGAFILDGKNVYHKDGLTFYGFPDAWFTPDSTTAPQDVYDKAERDQGHKFAETDRGPIDVLVVHNQEAAKAFIDKYPNTVKLVIVGHTHESAFYYYKDIPVINPGSITGAELRILDGGKPAPLGAAQVLFRKDAKGNLIPYSATRIEHNPFDETDVSVQVSPVKVPFDKTDTNASELVSSSN